MHPTNNKLACLTLLPILYLVTISFTNQDIERETGADKETIREIFYNWQSQQIKSHQFWAEDSCQRNFISKREFSGTIPEMFGFPDSSEIKFSFADIH